MKSSRAVLASLVAAVLFAVSASAQQEKAAEWSQPSEPFRIIGNVHYVGTTELGAYLISTPEGHILIDGGFDVTAPVILESIRKLGFQFGDVKVLLTTQAHMDHVGSMAALKQATGAKVMAMEGDAALLERGGQGDFAFGDTFMFPPVTVDRVLHDGDVVTLGGTTVTARHTPGHTRGCTTWTMTVKDGEESRAVVFAGSLSVNPPVRLVTNESYPEIRKDYERSFGILRSLGADVFLGAHAGFFRLHDKAARLLAGETPNPFIDRDGLRAWVDDMERQFNDRIEKERAATN
jgi:metallo-beta-lactamase class B